ncbi:MAG: lysophospholipid acyltransferase family protein [Chloroflexi bacterium]|nr:lysophospholipid acyltransferase family protein [Chloroflexota bacterium]
MEYWLFRLGHLLAPWLPIWMGVRLTTLFADVAYWLSPQRRAIVVANLMPVLNGNAKSGDAPRLVRQVFRHRALAYYDLLRVPSLDLDQLERAVTFHGWEHLTTAMAKGRGVILVAAHLGSFEVVAQVLAARGIPTTIVVERINSPRLFRFLTEIRSSRGIRMLPVDSPAVGTIYKTLRHQGIVGIVIDRYFQGKSVMLPFFGRPRAFPIGPYALAARTGAPILVGAAVRSEAGRYEAFFEPPLELASNGDPAQDARDTLAQALAILERYIRRYPGQWLAFEPVWATPQEVAIG